MLRNLVTEEGSPFSDASRCDLAFGAPLAGDCTRAALQQAAALEVPQEQRVRRRGTKVVALPRCAQELACVDLLCATFAGRDYAPKAVRAVQPSGQGNVHSQRLL